MQPELTHESLSYQFRAEDIRGMQMRYAILDLMQGENELADFLRKIRGLTSDHVLMRAIHDVL